MPVGTAPLSDIWRSLVLFRYRAGGNIARATFTRTSTAARYRHAGTGNVVAANVLRTEWVDVAGEGVREAPSTLLESARTQLVTDPENLAAWSVVGTMSRTGGQADPFGGTAAYLLDSNAGAGDTVVQAVTFTGDATKAAAVFLRGGTSARTAINIRDTTAGVNRHYIRASWSGGVPTFATAGGSGTIYTVSSLAGGWYALNFNVSGIIAANGHQFQILPDDIGGLGTVFVFGANAWNALFPLSYQGPSGGATTRSADAFSVPINFGPQDLTVFARLVRPFHADTTGTLGINPRIFEIGTSAASLFGNFSSAARTIAGQIDTATTDQSQTASIPAGTTLSVTWQFKNLTTGGQVAIDVGSGLSAFSSAATAFNAFGSQTLRIGGSGGDELAGGIMDLLIVRGLKSRTEMLQYAGIT